MRTVRLMVPMREPRQEYSEHCSGAVKAAVSLLFFEQEQVIAFRPGIQGCFDAKSRRSQLLDDDVLGDPVAATVRRHALNWIQTGARRKFNNRKTTAGLQGANQSGVEFCRFGQVVVDATQENVVAAFRRKIRIGVFAFEDDYVGKVTLGHFGTQLGEFALIYFGGEDFAGRADNSAVAKAYLPSPAPMSATIIPGFHSITAARRLTSSSAPGLARAIKTVPANTAQNNTAANEAFLFI